MDPQQPPAPTARLALQALAQASTPLSIEQIAIMTDSTALTQTRTLQRLALQGLVVRVRIGQRVYYTLPTTVQE